MSTRHDPRRASCECEHVAHGSDALTPKGRRGHHDYCAVETLVSVRTIWGTFRVCPACSGDCLAEYNLDNMTYGDFFQQVGDALASSREIHDVGGTFEQGMDDEVSMEEPGWNLREDYIRDWEQDRRLK
jgi:hypothetical protein